MKNIHVENLFPEHLLLLPEQLLFLDLQDVEVVAEQSQSSPSNKINVAVIELEDRAGET
jgi:hypothetical protein